MKIIKNFYIQDCDDFMRKIENLEILRTTNENSIKQAEDDIEIKKKEISDLMKENLRIVQVCILF